MQNLRELREVADRVVAMDSSLARTDVENLRRAIAQVYQEETKGELNRLATAIVEWRKRKQFNTNWYNVPEKLMLIAAELSEAMEAYRHLPPHVLRWLEGAPGIEVPEPGEWIAWSENFEEELADSFIRLVDLTSSLRIDLAMSVYAKMAANELRPIKHEKEC